MTVDVEDWFQVGAFENVINRDDWDDLPCRVDRNTHEILDLFADKDVKATFFTLGWVAERYPNLIKRIVRDGHELASHGYSHYRVTQQSRAEFEEDINKTKKMLEDLGGTEVIGYRAPSYSIGQENLWAHEVIEDAGYLYSSSVYPIVHDHYGMPDAPRFPYMCRENLLEIPISTLIKAGKTMPIGGGGYFRLFPYCVSKWAVGSVNNNEEQSTLFYFHPWEIDPDQPRQKNASAKSRFRHYLNLKKMKPRLERLCNDFSWSTMKEVFYEPAQSLQLTVESLQFQSQ